MQPVTDTLQGYPAVDTLMLMLMLMLMIELADSNSCPSDGSKKNLTGRSILNFFIIVGAGMLRNQIPLEKLFAGFGAPW
jgi:hypothetical protein